MLMSAKFLGTCDDVNVCDCCGKKDLKATVALSIDDGEAVYYGVVCAARALKTDAKTVRSETRKADDEKHRAKMEADRLAHEAKMRPWQEFLAKHGEGRDMFTQIQSLGGFKVAWAKYEENNLKIV